MMDSIESVGVNEDDLILTIDHSIKSLSEENEQNNLKLKVIKW